jgi:hypothetical protein
MPRHFAAPKGLQFFQPRATPWGGEEKVIFGRPNGPTLRLEERLARWADARLRQPVSQGVALGWENEGPSAQRGLAIENHYAANGFPNLQI